MKKIIAMILSLSVAVSLFGGMAVTAADTALTEEQQTLLKVTGVYNEDASFGDTLTRGEFAIMIAKVAFGLNADISNYSSGSDMVADVSFANSAYDAVMALYSLGYIKTDKFGCFYPDKKITQNDAAEIALSVMGYSDSLIPQGYTKLNYASEKGLLKGVSGGELAAGDAYRLIFNMLNCDVSDLKIKNNNNKNNDDEVEFMTVRLRIYQRRGIVTDDGEMSLYGKTNIGEGYISINDSEGMLNKTGRDDLFGLNVGGYYIYDNILSEKETFDSADLRSSSADRDYILIAVYERTSKNNKIVINSDDITDFKDRTYYYRTEDSSKDKKTYIPKDAVIVYNNGALRLEDNFDISMFKPSNGIVRLYDNNGDGEIDIVKIEEYETYIVSLANSTQETIYVKDEKPFLSLKDKKYTIEDTKGTRLKLNQIAKGNVISVMKALDNEHIKIIVSSYSQNETVESLGTSDDTGRTYVTTSAGGKYELSKYAQENYSKPELNISYKFWFDMFDRVAGYEKDETNLDNQIGYLVWIRALDDTGEDEYGAKIYTSNGEFELFNLNKKVKVQDENDKITTYKPEEVLANVSYTGVIRYKINSNLQITNIEIPHKYGEKPDSTDRLYYMLDTVNHEKKEDYYLQNRDNTINFGGAGVITESTSVFSVPNDITDYEEYEIGNYSSFAVGQYYSLYLFGTNYKSKIAACACFASSASQGTAITNEFPETVTEVHYVYNDKKAEDMYQIQTVKNTGETATYYMEKDVYENKVKCIAAGNTQPVAIAAGDVIFLATSADYITKAVLAYDASQYVTDEKGNKLKGAVAGTNLSYYSASDTLSTPFVAENYIGGNPGSVNAWRFNGGTIKLFLGWVYSYEDGYMTITNQNPAYGFDHNATRDNGFIIETQYLNLPYTTVLTKGRKGKVSVKKASTEDVKPYTVYGADCSRVLVTMRVYAQFAVLLMNED